MTTESAPNLQNALANVLQQIGREPCLQAAEAIEQQGLGELFINLRSLMLSQSELCSFAKIINQASDHDRSRLRSISFSYNSRIENGGIACLMSCLPPSLKQLGLVDCGLSEQAGWSILAWMERTQGLEMVCIEQNDWHSELRTRFAEFKSANPQVVFIY